MRRVSKMERPASVEELARELYGRYDRVHHHQVQHLIYQMRMRWDLGIVYSTKRKAYFLAG